jgi:hypothetical protein
MRENMQCLSFWVWLYQLTWWFKVPSIFLQNTWFCSSSWMNSTPLCIYQIFFIHLNVYRHLGWVCGLAIVNSVTINMDMSLLSADFDSFWYMPRSYSVAGSYGYSIRFLKNLRTSSYSGCTNLHCYQYSIKAPFPPCPHQHLLFVFLVTAILSGMRWTSVSFWFASFWWLMKVNTFHIFIV